MTRALFLAILFALAGLPASAACYADYKAKRGSPLELQYGVIQLPDGACGNRQRAADVIARRIARDGWQLLNVMSVFGPEGLNQRKDRAGAYFLRY
jgi:hypothetical protein